MLVWWQRETHSGESLNEDNSHGMLQHRNFGVVEDTQVNRQESGGLFSCIIACFVFVALQSATTASQAAPIYGTPAPMTGMRSVVGNGLVTAASPVWDKATISWEVVDNMDGTNTITYTFSNFGIVNLDPPFDSSLAISHVTIDLSDDAVGDPNAVTSPMIDGSPLGGEHVELGDKDGITGAVKLNLGTEFASVVYSFTTNREIVFGDLFVKADQAFLTNSGFGDRLSEDPIDYIARPNGIIPEPSTFVLATCGLLGLLTYGWQRRRRA